MPLAFQTASSRAGPSRPAPPSRSLSGWPSDTGWDLTGLGSVPEPGLLDAPPSWMPLADGVGRARHPLDADLASWVRERPLTRGTDLHHADLVACVDRRDPVAFERVAGSLGPTLERFLQRRLPLDRDAACDVVQETFLMAWRNLHRVRGASHFRPWLFRVARNAGVSFLRRTRRGGRMAAGLDGVEALAPPAPGGSVRHGDVRELARWLGAGEAAKGWATGVADPLRMALRRALAQLRPPDVLVIRLHYLEGMDTLHMAVLMGLPRTTIKMRLHRARRRLRRHARAACDVLPRADARIVQESLARRADGLTCVGKRDWAEPDAPPPPLPPTSRAAP